MTMESTSEVPSPSFADFIRLKRAQILDEWKGRVRAIPAARRLSEPQLLDHVPHLLDNIASLSEHLACGHPPETLEVEAIDHAFARMKAGFELEQVVIEFRLLRECILTAWERDQAPLLPSKSSTLPVNAAIDRAIEDSVGEYVALRTRVARGLDLVSTVAMGSMNLSDFLSRLLRVFKDEMPSVQTCVILLREGERLHVRAAIGLEEELAGEGFSLRVGEGFAGTIAQTGKPLLLHAASTDPLMLNPVIQRRGVKGLFGVPLLDQAGKVVGVAHMGSLTARDFPPAERELFKLLASRAALAIEYHQAKDSAERAVQVRDEVLGVVSHDLRSPLGVVFSAADLLERALSPGRLHQANKALETIRRSTRRMTRLVEDLLDYGSIQSEQLRLRLTRENAWEIVDEVADTHASIASEQGVNLERSLQGKLPAIDCDRDRIFQVFGNLIGNALKVSPAGSTITVGAQSGDAGVRFWVSDEGPGLSDQSADRVFDRYWRAPDAHSRGRGLGLAIVKGLVEAHGGTVGLETSLGRGCTFYFWLPVAQQRALPAPSADLAH
jgi:signal transduction histidine kinase